MLYVSAGLAGPPSCYRLPSALGSETLASRGSRHEPQEPSNYTSMGHHVVLEKKINVFGRNALVQNDAHQPILCLLGLPILLDQMWVFDCDEAEWTATFECQIGDAGGRFVNLDGGTSQHL
jgi:hypothetical protein